jgi:hypothetical protein
MEIPLFEPRCAEFCFPRLNTLVRVEVSDGSVTIRATRDTFSPRRKDFFIRELAAEGFIPEQFQWSAPDDTGTSYGRIRWLVDYTWLSLSEEDRARSRRMEFRFLSLAVLLLSLLMELGLPGLLGDSRTAMRSEKPVNVQMQKSATVHSGLTKTSEQALESDFHGIKPSDNAKLQLPNS